MESSRIYRRYNSIKSYYDDVDRNPEYHTSIVEIGDPETRVNFIQYEN